MKHLRIMKHLKIIAAVIGVPILLALAACGGGGGGGGEGGGGGAAAGPTVIATNPPDTANGAALTQSIVAVFSQALNATTVNVGSYTLTGPLGPVSGTVALLDNAVHFTPSAPLAFNTDYTARLTTAIKDTAGNPLAADYVWRFSTGKKIAAGGFHTCARLGNGRVKCWGLNNSGQLGLGDADDRGDQANEMGDDLPVVDLGAGRMAVELIAGGRHNCARLDDGQVKCWGSNDSGQLGLGNIDTRGDGANEMGDNLPAVDLGTGRTAIEVVASASRTCARLDNGQVKCWGINSRGELGLGDINNRGDGANEMGDLLPVVNFGTGSGPFAGNLTVVELTAGAAGASHTCARLRDPLVAGPTRVKCWGDNDFGQLGLGDINARGDGANEMGNNLPAVNVGQGFFGDLTVLEVVAGRNHACARLGDDEVSAVKCWGLNSNGQLGLGDINTRGNGPNEMGNNLPAVDIGT